MGRFIQRHQDARGSLKWIQHAVNQKSGYLDSLLLPPLGGATKISWKSPLASDEFAEYRDSTFLNRIEADVLAGELTKFWPARGPQWDALAVSDRGDRLLVEAKAHIEELCSPASQAAGTSREMIEAALSQTAQYLGANQHAAWTTLFYQMANRLAHLYFLRKQGLNAWLVLINFVGDKEMFGPTSPAEWKAAYQIVWFVLGLPKSHKLSRYVIEIYPDIEVLSTLVD
jgi:hypothetical protein